MTELGWVTLLPPVVAIALAIWSRQVYLSLAGGAWLAWTILDGWNPIRGLGDTIAGTVSVLSSRGDAEVILFTFVIGLSLRIYHQRLDV